MAEYNEHNLPTEYDGIMRLASEDKITLNQTAMGGVNVQLIIITETDQVYYRWSRGDAAWSQWLRMPDADVGGLEEFGQVVLEEFVQVQHEFTSAHGVNLTVTHASLATSETETTEN